VPENRDHEIFLNGTVKKRIVAVLIMSHPWLQAGVRDAAWEAALRA